MLALDNGSAALGVLGVGHVLLVSHLGLLGLDGSLGRLLVAVVKLAMLEVGDAVLVLLGENLCVLDGLHGLVVVILVDLLVDGRVYLLVTGRLDRLMLDGRRDVFFDSGVVLTRLVQVLAEGLLGAVHFE